MSYDILFVYKNIEDSGGIMSNYEIIAEIEKLRWYHSIEIEKGIITKGKIKNDILKQKYKGLCLPDDLTGLSVLDIGANDGFFSFEVEKRGAERIVALELRPENHCISQAIKLKNSKVELIKGSVYDLTPEKFGKFDIVLFLGVFYHLRYPLLALDKISSISNNLMLIETHFLNNHLVLDSGEDIPINKLYNGLDEFSFGQFYRFDEMNKGDFSNWFSFTRVAIENMLKSAGFDSICLNDRKKRILIKCTKENNEPEYIRYQI